MTENHPEILTGDQIKDLNDAKRGKSFGHTLCSRHWSKGDCQMKPIVTPEDCTTIGDLVVSIMDAALEVTRNERKAYRLSGLVLSKMLRPCPLLIKQPDINFRRKSRLDR
jgi:hypothetical protein